MPGKSFPRIAVAAALVTPASALALEQPHPGFEIGLRTGYALPGGRQGVPTDGKDQGVDEFVTGQWPFWLDVGYRLTGKVYLGAFLQYGVGVVNDAQEFCRLPPSLHQPNCSVRDIRLGLDGRYHFDFGGFSPWLGYGLGYEWWSFKVDYNLGVGATGTDPDLEDSWSGFEFANLQVGADLQILRRLILGPFISFSLDQFRNFTRTLNSPAMTAKYDVSNRSVHEWLFFGVRIAFTP
jgi:opacity protein-like surface antigen